MQHGEGRHCSHEIIGYTTMNRLLEEEGELYAQVRALGRVESFN
jgi:hypothetical protein